MQLILFNCFNSPFSQDSDAEINGKNVQQIELNSKHITIHQLSEEESNEERRTAR